MTRSSRRTEISPEDRVRDARARWCAKWMKLTFTVALLAFGATWFTSATNLGHPLLPYLAVISILANIFSAVVIRMARRVAPSRFPVTWRGKAGNVGGFGLHLLLTFMSVLMFLLATRIFD
ncbi:hypothetical protein SAMN05421812_101630 [Asanoa hainanensis]|uniref:Uncharacterized protein n=1 Tax=Asanoa hainanensis TaxID=560556 RepID=A0A239GZL7_9ACTN|nr:hypothetical protein [Asanoa hainanensis]SNS74587.1 hypothetical protein SAMN05421812_101630 [Asanoa hainanensis]